MSSTSSGSRNVKVSVAMITYNHEQFIAQAIEGVLMQRTDFAYELIIGEDCSTDGTRAIVRAYGEKYPGLVRPLLSNRNQGGYANFLATWRACRGQYVALCEGDDYWTHARKLQEQVDFLDRNPDCTICFHDIQVVFEDGSRPPRIRRPVVVKHKYALVDLLRGNFVPTCSAMVRGGVVDDFPDWFYGVSVGDWPFLVLHARYGKIGYLDKTMASYRVHSGGVWGGTSSEQRMLGLVDLLEHMNAHLDFQYSRVINETISKTHFWLAVHYMDCGRPADARASLMKSLSRQPVNSRIKRLDMATLVARLYFPRIHRVLRRLRLSLSSTTESEQ